MNDDELIGYCEIHCTTERALFSANQINRMIVLAGLGDHNALTPGWYPMHEEMQELVDLARAAKKENHD
jgi:hypothetical protein